MATVILEKVSKVYPGNVWAVRDVDLTIGDEEFVVLVGPSGCGKTTTLRMVAGLEDISSGTIRIGTRIVNNVAPKDRDIAMVFQNYALYPHMTVYKNMAFGLKLRRMPRAEIQKRVMEAATTLDIVHLLDRKPKALSGGQRQRVAVGRAIVREPAAFLFDEPLSNLDAKLRTTTRAELKRLHQKLRTTTIYVTHDQEEAMTLGDRIVVMKDGIIQQADTPLVTYNRPVNRFVAGFIGTPPMNFFDGMLSAKNGKMVFEEGRLANARAVGGGVDGSSGRDGAGAADEPVVMVGTLTCPGNGFTLSVPEQLHEKLAGVVGSHVVVGVRPEHVRLTPFDGGQAIRVRPLVVEPLGNNMDVYMNTALHEHVIARVEAMPGVQTDGEMTAYVDAKRIHVFEPGETGVNLASGKSKVGSAHALA
jgi:multiple sugar transport system ATP-binding protein